MPRSSLSSHCSSCVEAAPQVAEPGLRYYPPLTPIPAMWAIHSGSSEPPVPDEPGQAFRGNWATGRSEATLGSFSYAFWS